MINTQEFYMIFTINTHCFHVHLIFPFIFILFMHKSIPLLFIGKKWAHKQAIMKQRKVKFGIYKRCDITIATSYSIVARCYSDVALAGINSDTATTAQWLMSTAQ